MIVLQMFVQTRKNRLSTMVVEKRDFNNLTETHKIIFREEKSHQIYETNTAAGVYQGEIRGSGEVDPIKRIS